MHQGKIFGFLENLIFLVVIKCKMKKPIVHMILTIFIHLGYIVFYIEKDLSNPPPWFR